MSCEHCLELKLEIAGLRAERDALLEQREATKLWLAGYLVGSPLDSLRGEQDKLAHLHATARAVARKFPGQKIPQIKELRNLTDLGLKESKDLIEAIWAKGLGDGGGAP